VITLIIVTFNSEAVIQQCLTSVLHVLPPSSEVIVVDNASSDQTRDILGSFPDVRVIESDTNIGYGAACNAGARLASGSYLLFANADVILLGINTDLLVDDLARGPVGLAGFSFRAGDHAAAAGSGLFSYPRWWSGIVKSSWGLVQPSAGARLLRRCLVQSTAEGAWASGALFAVAREVWEDVGGFDERYFLYFEDVDLCRTVLERGLRVVASRALAAVHAHGQSSGQRDMATAAAWEAASWLLYVAKWYGRRRAALAVRLLTVNLRIVEALLALALIVVPDSKKLATKRCEVHRVAAEIRSGLEGHCVAGARSPAQSVAVAVGRGRR